MVNSLAIAHIVFSHATMRLSSLRLNGFARTNTMLDKLFNLAKKSSSLISVLGESKDNNYSSDWGRNLRKYATGHVVGLDHASRGPKRTVRYDWWSQPWRKTKWWKLCYTLWSWSSTFWHTSEHLRLGTETIGFHAVWTHTRLMWHSSKLNKTCNLPSGGVFFLHSGQMWGYLSRWNSESLTKTWGGRWPLPMLGCLLIMIKKKKNVGNWRSMSGQCIYWVSHWKPSFEVCHMFGFSP